jgi:hypothetical protein
VTSRRFSPVSSTTKIDRHGLAEILLKVALHTLQKPKEMSQGQIMLSSVCYVQCIVTIKVFVESDFIK